MLSQKLLSQAIACHLEGAQDLHGEVKMLTAERAELAAILADYIAQFDLFRASLLARADAAIARAILRLADHQASGDGPVAEPGHG